EAARGHAFDHVPAEVEHPVQVDPQHRVPLLALHLAQGGVAGDAGGVDEDVERAVPGDDVTDQPPAGVAVGPVAGGEMDVEPGRFPGEGFDAFAAVAQVD